MLRETQTRQQFRSTNYPGSPLGSATEVAGIQSSAKSRFGFTVGGGAEYAVNEHWSFRADYGYTRFGKESFTFDKASAGAAQTSTEMVGVEVVPPSLPPDAQACTRAKPHPNCFERIQNVYQTFPGTYDSINGRDATNAFDMHTLKLGINYRF